MKTRTTPRSAFTLSAVRTAWAMAALLGGFVLQCAVAAAAEEPARSDPLPRRPFLGLRFAPLSDSLRSLEGHAGSGGYYVVSVDPGSGAQQAGVPERSILLQIGATKVGAPGSISRAMGAYSVGDTVHLLLWKSAAEVRRTVKLTGAPEESSREFEIHYGSVAADGKRFRTIVTSPKEGGRHPALFVIQGLGCFSVEESVTPGTYAPILYELTRRGFVTMRVDKPGTGDSEGGPCPEVDFQGELPAYHAALRALKALDSVDSSSVFIFGHSMGGIMAPILAAETPVRGIIVYGTGFRNWLEYDLENTRRQLRLEGASYDSVDAYMRRQQRFDMLFYVQGLTPGRIVRDHPEFAADYPDTVHLFAGKHYRYFQQIYALNLPRIWKDVDASVLAMWGTSDFVSSRTDHEQLADAVSSFRPGKGTFLPLERTDHWLNLAASPQESMAQLLNGTRNPAFLEEMNGWMQRILGEPRTQ